MNDLFYKIHEEIDKQQWTKKKIIAFLDYANICLTQFKLSMDESAKRAFFKIKDKHYA